MLPTADRQLSMKVPVNSPRSFLKIPTLLPCGKEGGEEDDTRGREEGGEVREEERERERKRM